MHEVVNKTISALLQFNFFGTQKQYMTFWCTKIKPNKSSSKCQSHFGVDCVRLFDRKKKFAFVLSILKGMVMTVFTIPFISFDAFCCCYFIWQMFRCIVFTLKNVDFYLFQIPMAASKELILFCCCCSYCCCFWMNTKWFKKDFYSGNFTEMCIQSLAKAKL